MLSCYWMCSETIGDKVAKLVMTQWKAWPRLNWRRSLLKTETEMEMKIRHWKRQRVVWRPDNKNFLLGRKICELDSHWLKIHSLPSHLSVIAPRDGSKFHRVSVSLHTAIWKKLFTMEMPSNSNFDIRCAIKNETVSRTDLENIGRLFYKWKIQRVHTTQQSHDIFSWSRIETNPLKFQESAFGSSNGSNANFHLQRLISLPLFTCATCGIAHERDMDWCQLLICGFRKT